MLFRKFTRYWARLIPALILVPLIINSFLTPVQAQGSIDLVLGGTGSTSWDISNIQPGDSGTETVELHNAGDITGQVIIWISDIVSGEGINPESETGDTSEPGELINYLLFNQSCSKLKANLILPATINNFPQSVSAAKLIIVGPLDAGETATLVWDWQSQETGGPQNDSQGDTLSFTINYTLQEWWPTVSQTYMSSTYTGGGGEQSSQQLKISILGKVTTARVSASGELLDSFIATDPENKYSLKCDQGVKITSAYGTAIKRIEMMSCEKPLPPPDGMQLIGQAHDIVGYIGDSGVLTIVFDKPVKLTMSYDPDSLPENTSSIFIASYDAQQGWIKLEPSADSTDKSGEITALITRGSTFAILVELATTEPAPVETVPAGEAPAGPVPTEPVPAGPETSSTTVLPQTGEEIPPLRQDVPVKQSIAPPPTGDNEPLQTVSLIIAVTGVTVMTVLAYIQRRRRSHQEVKPA